MGALDGVKVLDLGLLVQGPQAAAMLADFGASVIKVELPKVGDQARWIGLGEDDPRAPYFHSLNRGKRSITLDLRRPDGANVLKRMVVDVDVVISNFKPGTLDGWGLGYDVLSAINPRVVYATGSAFGPIGPDAEREGADLAGQAAGGLIMTTGTDGGEPTPVGATIADHIASQNMTSGILAALLARERTGKGQRVDVSLVGGQVWAQAAEYTAFFMTGRQPGRANRGHPLLNAAYGIVETADGWIALIGVPPHLRAAFYEAIERPDLGADPRFQPYLITAETKQELFAELAPVFRTRTSAHWLDRLRAAGQRVAPVRDYAAVVADPQTLINGYVIDGGDPAIGTTHVVGSPVRFSATPATPAHAAPELGQHTEEILLEFGYGWDEITQLRETGAL